MNRDGNRHGWAHSKPRGRGDSLRRSPVPIKFTHEFAEQLIATAQVIIKVLDRQGRIVRFNPYMEEVSGYRLREMEGRDWFETFLPAHEQDRMRAIFARCIRGEAVDAFTSTVVTKGGELRAIDWRASALRDGSRGVVGVLSIGKDITQRVQAERELYELNKVAQQRERRRGSDRGPDRP
jgi:PAS domain S-box-containing protein